MTQSSCRDDGKTLHDDSACWRERSNGQSLRRVQPNLARTPAWHAGGDYCRNDRDGRTEMVIRMGHGRHIQSSFDSLWAKLNEGVRRGLSFPRLGIALRKLEQDGAGFGAGDLLK